MFYRCKGDGRITAADQVYYQIKESQDFDRSSNTMKAVLNSFRQSLYFVHVGLLLCAATACAQPSSGSLDPRSRSFPDTKLAVNAVGGDGRPMPARLAFEPGPDGSPLPPRTADAAHNWPPEFKTFLDTALQTLKRGGQLPAPEVIAKSLGIQLQENPVDQTMSGVLREFRVLDVPFGPADPKDARHVLTLVGRTNLANRSWHLHILVDPKRYCINPYEIAIYLGEPFFSGTQEPHAIPDWWPKSYTWGMFKRGYQGVHIAPSLWLSTGRQPYGSTTTEPNCIGAFIIIRQFTLEK